jgi:anti-sigma regulatory factor (Ser/Thr protein kinase)
MASVDNGRFSSILKEVGPTDLEALRRLITRAARRAGLKPDAGISLVIAVNEAVTNAIRHATGTAKVVISNEPRERRLVVAVSDDGPGIPPGVVGQLPDHDATAGRGLYLMKALCDEVQIVTNGTGVTGTLVRLVMTVKDT